MNSEVLRFSVGDLIAVVNQTFDYAYSSIEVEGEVSSFKVNQGKYVFFDLKDSTGIVNCFMTVWQLRVPIEDGMKVIVSATPKLTNKGRFSLTVKSLKLSGQGSIKKSFEILKTKLDSEGLFSDDRKRPLPVEPYHIAVISSVQAAGYADFMEIINKRWGGLRVDVANVQVQGVSAPDQIINAINHLNQVDDLPQAIVIVRGGGNSDDLATFNDEKLVRVVAGSRIPILIGVGHETDISLCDLVADVSAITPSSAAQTIVPDRDEIIRSNNYKIRLLPTTIDSYIDEQSIKIENDISNLLDKLKLSVDEKFTNLELTKSLLNQVNPMTILNRGYAVVRGDSRVGEIINIESSEKIILAEVKDVREK